MKYLLLILLFASACAPTKRMGYAYDTILKSGIKLSFNNQVPENEKQEAVKQLEVKTQTYIFNWQNVLIKESISCNVANVMKNSFLVLMPWPFTASDVKGVPAGHTQKLNGLYRPSVNMMFASYAYTLWLMTVGHEMGHNILHKCTGSGSEQKLLEFHQKYKDQIPY